MTLIANFSGAVYKSEIEIEVRPNVLYLSLELQMPLNAIS